MRSTINSGYLITLCSFALAGVGCEDEAEGLADGGTTPVDAGMISTDTGASPDAGSVDVPVDAGLPDLGPPERVLVRRRLMGSLPIENLVMNPLFDTTTSLAPVLFNGQLPARQVRFDAPAGTPLIAFNGPNGLLINVQGAAAPLEISMWVGRPEGAAEIQLDIGLVGVGRSSIQSGTALVPSATTENAGGIAWTLWTGRTDEDILGNGFLFLQTQAAGSIFLNGPSVIAAQGRVVGPVAPSVPLRLDLESQKRLMAAATRLREAWGRQLAPPSTPSLKQLPHPPRIKAGSRPPRPAANARPASK